MKIRNKNKNYEKSINALSDRPIRLAVLQRVCTGYRIPLFSRLASAPEIELTLFIGEDVPNSKVRSQADLMSLPIRKMKTCFIRFGSRVLPWHLGLIWELRKLNPDVILCEGESHFFGYVQAVLYRTFFNRRAALIHWCFISLPGWAAVGGKGHRSLIKRFFRLFFDAFVVYSSFSKGCLLQLGQLSEKVFVATNVGDTERFLRQSDSIDISAVEARCELSLPERFTVLYLGTLDVNKRPNIMLDLAKECDSASFNFVLLGSGPLLEELRERAIREGLSNVFLPGRIVDNLSLYLCASDAFLLPGRGGISISEAMAYRLPVVVHQGDGTEYDLVQDEQTGFHLSDGNVCDFRKALEFLCNNPEKCSKMGSRGRTLLEMRFNTNNMVRQIILAVQYAKNKRSTHNDDVE